MIEQAGLFDGPEDDSFVLEIMRRFDGYVAAIRERPAAKEQPAVWVEIIRPPAQRRRNPGPLGHGGVPVPEHLDETVTVHNRSKNKNGIAIHPWRLVWSESREPLHVGLFESERAAGEYRRKAR